MTKKIGPHCVEAESDSSHRRVLRELLESFDQELRKQLGCANVVALLQYLSVDKKLICQLLRGSSQDS